MKEWTGRRIKDARKKKDMTAAELAEKVGVTVTTISRWECDNAKPMAIFVKVLDRVLGK